MEICAAPAARVFPTRTPSVISWWAVTGRHVKARQEPRAARGVGLPMFDDVTLTMLRCPLRSCANCHSGTVAGAPISASPPQAWLGNGGKLDDDDSSTKRNSIRSPPRVLQPVAGRVVAVAAVAAGRGLPAPWQHRQYRYRGVAAAPWLCCWGVTGRTFNGTREGFGPREGVLVSRHFARGGRHAASRQKGA